MKFWPVSAATTNAIRTIVIVLVVVAVLGWRANLFGARSESPFVSATTLTDLVRASDVVLIGVIDKASGTRNLARNPNDLSQEDRNLTVVGQDYLVRVSTVLKGSAAAKSTITVARGRGTAAPLVTNDADWIPLAVGQEYVLFLRTVPYDSAVLALAIEPSRFRVATEVRAESPWRQADKYFPPQNREDFLAALTAAVASAR
jgi:hypothetical protein